MTQMDSSNRRRKPTRATGPTPSFRLEDGKLGLVLDIDNTLVHASRICSIHHRENLFRGIEYVTYYASRLDGQIKLYCPKPLIHDIVLQPADNEQYPYLLEFESASAVDQHDMKDPVVRELRTYLMGFLHFPPDTLGKSAHPLRMRDIVTQPTTHRVFWIVQLRPGVRAFLEAMHSKANLYVYTHGTLRYAQLICTILDPMGRYGLLRRLLTGDTIRPLPSDEVTPTASGGSMRAKSLHHFGFSRRETERVLVLDDRPDVWHSEQMDHVIRVHPWLYWNCTSEHIYVDATSPFPSRFPSLLPAPTTIPAPCSLPATTTTTIVSTSTASTATATTATIAKVSSATSPSMLSSTPLKDGQSLPLPSTVVAAPSPIVTLRSSGSCELDVTKPIALIPSFDFHEEWMKWNNNAQHIFVPHVKRTEHANGDNNNGGDDTMTDNVLSSIGTLLDAVHMISFNAEKQRRRQYYSDAADVSSRSSHNHNTTSSMVARVSPISVWRHMRASILFGVKILFYSSLNTDYPVRQTAAWHFARGLGAKCCSQLEDNITHLLLVEPGMFLKVIELRQIVLNHHPPALAAAAESTLCRPPDTSPMIRFRKDPKLAWCWEPRLYTQLLVQRKVHVVNADWLHHALAHYYCPVAREDRIPYSASCPPPSPVPSALCGCMDASMPGMAMRISGHRKEYIRDITMRPARSRSNRRSLATHYQHFMSQHDVASLIVPQLQVLRGPFMTTTSGEEEKEQATHKELKTRTTQEPLQVQSHPVISLSTLPSAASILSAGVPSSPSPSSPAHVVAMVKEISAVPDTQNTTEDSKKSSTDGTCITESESPSRVTSIPSSSLSSPSSSAAMSKPTANYTGKRRRSPHNVLWTYTAAASSSKRMCTEKSTSRALKS